MIKTYEGSCHCGAVRFQCQLDLAPGPEVAAENPRYASTFKCNCSICTKSRFWKVFAKAADFRLLQGQDALSDYQFGERMVHHHFCKHCGVRPFGRGHLDVMGGDFYAVNVACLDGVPTHELVAAPVTYEDGRHDQWDQPPTETRQI